MTPSAHILVVDDDPDIGQLIKDYLQQFNLACTPVLSGIAMDAAMAAAPFDLVILDVMLPGEDGFSLCRRLRAQSSLPILMLTARGEAFDRVVGLELGADDYVVKPFEPRELLARVRSLLRRSQMQAPAAEQAQPEAVAPPLAQARQHFAGWSLDLTQRQLTSPDGVVVALSTAEFKLLQVFLHKPGRVLSREQLLDEARGRNIEAFDRSIDLLVSRLRHKLGEDPKDPKLIRTLRGEGYIFTARPSP
ncbi:MAG TPA: response regulator transcription factor [Marinagarivorans sp.]|nr:response regulator transcription factor [Cellvibrionaceae bacterium]HMY38049.1 response regulator transcription factor [Marinagarivorans sp.]HNG61821.1 response regulator transcription factor [Cellvibrionaceae bacterium]